MFQIKYSAVTLFVLFILSISLSLRAQTRNPDITVQELEKHIYFLASDSLEGRKPGTKGAKEAAVYIREQYAGAGLQPMGENGFQYFNVTTSITKGLGNQLKINNTVYKLNTDFVPLVFSSNDTLFAEVVFTGFGLKPEQDSIRWDDYKDVDVAGKWVLVLRGDPEPDEDESVFILNSSDRDKALLARDHDAAGILLVNGPQFGDKLTGNSFEHVTADVGIPAINITQTVADQLLEKSGFTIDSLEKEIIKSKQPHSFSTGATLYAVTDVVKNEVATQNIMYFIEGSDPELKNEYVIIGAHYDHLGLGGHGSGSRMPDTVAVHNGADDNASGTAGILELAEKLDTNRDQLRRSVLFISFGAEEMGLLGSQYFTNHPLIDLKNVEIMFNFDMIGRLDTTNKGIMVAGTGTAVGLDSLLVLYEKNSSLAFNHSPGGYGASDHASFYASGIPVLFFTTGAHNDYHTPFDDADKINYEGEKEVLDYAYPLIVDLINNDSGLTYREAEPGKKKAGVGRGLKVKLGIMPDFTSAGNDGLGVGGVTKGGPAWKAGMMKGDKIIAINGLKVTNIYDYMNRLKKFKPGQTISVDVIRNDKKTVLIVVL